jgi:hypothetical protein
MIFRSKKRRVTNAEPASGPPPEEAVVDNGRPVESLLEEIDALARGSNGGDVHRVLQLRHRAGLKLLEGNRRQELAYPEPAFDQLSGDSELPTVHPPEATPELLRAAILRHGCLLIRGLVEEDEAARLRNEIDRAYEARGADGGRQGDSSYFEAFQPDARFDLAFERALLLGSAGLWVADSPRVMAEILDLFERVGLTHLATDYLGERPAISVNKSLLRKVKPTQIEDTDGSKQRSPSAWHQDGAFMGDVRALNVWLSLSRCGDVAPGMDVVPRRLDQIVPTGTEGAVFDWSVSRAVTEEAAGEVEIMRPIFEAGDVLLFDELFLHATAAEPEMPNMRYAVESWFFGPSAFPSAFAPLAV